MKNIFIKTGNNPNISKDSELKTGIWLDYHQAYIVYLLENHVNMIRLDSGVEDYHVHGGAAAPRPFGSHDAVSERRFLERKRQQLNKYFKTIKERIKTCGAIYICGPAEAKIGLKREIIKDTRLKNIPVTVEACDSMTENQLLAHIKSYFSQ